MAKITWWIICKDSPEDDTTEWRVLAHLGWRKGNILPVVYETMYCKIYVKEKTGDESIQLP